MKWLLIIILLASCSFKMTTTPQTRCVNGKLYYQTSTKGVFEATDKNCIQE